MALIPTRVDAGSRGRDRGHRLGYMRRCRGGTEVQAYNNQPSIKAGMRQKKQWSYISASVATYRPADHHRHPMELELGPEH